MPRRLASVLAIALLGHAPSGAASYAQMTLPGLGADILFLVIAAWALVVDVVLLCKGFRRRWIVIVSTAVSLLLLSGYVWDGGRDVQASLDNRVQEWEARLQLAALVLIPLTMLVAPVLQHLELRRRPTRRAAYVAIAVPVMLAGIGWTFSHFDDHPLASTRAEWERLGNRARQVRPGELAALREEFEKRHKWGSTESERMLKALDDSALIRGNADLSPEDRKALADMLDRDRRATRPRAVYWHSFGYSTTKLLWDTLEPGNVERRIPRDVLLHNKALLEFIDLHGPQRLCSADGLAAADRRALFRALVQWNTPEIAAPVNRSLDGLEEACRTGSAAARP